MGAWSLNLNFRQREVHDVRRGVDSPGDPDLDELPLSRQLADDEPADVGLLEHGVHEHRHVAAPGRLVEHRHVHGADRLVRVGHAEVRRAVPYPDPVGVLRCEQQRRHRARRRGRPIVTAAVRKRRRPEAERLVHLDGL